jgi:hypothetical protein
MVVEVVDVAAGELDGARDPNDCPWGHQGTAIKSAEAGSGEPCCEEEVVVGVVVDVVVGVVVDVADDSVDDDVGAVAAAAVTAGAAVTGGGPSCLFVPSDWVV